MPKLSHAAIEPAEFTAALEAAKLEALYQFAYGLSHEINNPLANIAARAETLLADEKEPERRRKLAVIMQQAFRAHEMIADLMLFARPPELRPEPTDLARLADTVVAEMQPLAAEQSTRLSRVGESEAVIANIDRTQIAVALKALVQNALEAVKQGGSVEVGVGPGSGFGDQDSERLAAASTGRRRRVRNSTSMRRKSAVASEHHLIPAPHVFNPQSAIRNPQFLTVTDTGPGIPGEIRPHIFDPFFCGREAGRGLGLGLSKAWRIVTLHGGTIRVDSEPGEGARLVVELPGGARP
jgi:signal transduction histidine kinase